MPSITFTRRQALAVLAAALAVVVALAAVRRGSGGGADPVGATTAAIPPLTTPATTTAATLLVVDVAGAVRRPGLYRLPQGSRVADAIARAGGLTAKAQDALVNLAAPLADGEQVLVPAPGAAGPGAAAGGGSAGPVDLNSATAEQLDALPGVGPVTAQKIVDYRTAHGPFASLDDLDAIPGIGPSRIDQLRGLVTPS